MSKSRRSPQGRITIYGRNPVLEALRDPAMPVLRVFIATGARGEAPASIAQAAEARGIELRRLPADQVTRISRNGRQDQGVAADLDAPLLQDLAAYLDRGAPARCRLILLDGITTQDNAGLILRSARAAGLDGAVLPVKGTAKLDPRVVKASAGAALTLPVLTEPESAMALARLRSAGFRTLGLAAGQGTPLFGYAFPPRCVLVLGSETAGIAPAARGQIDDWLSIPMAPGIDSLNVACAATLACFELDRRA